MPNRITKEQAIAKYLIPGDPNECWKWGGHIDRSHGYGSVRCNYVSYYAHRLSYEYHFGPIPDGMFVCHHCDNPSCVNPSHLFLGTPADNSRDMAAKGRSNHHTHLRGESHQNAKLTEEDVRQIRQLYAEGVSQHELARRFAISRKQIQHIVKRLQWTHI